MLSVDIRQMSLPLTLSGKRASGARVAILRCNREYMCTMFGTFEVLQKTVLPLAGNGRTHRSVNLLLKIHLK